MRFGLQLHGTLAPDAYAALARRAEQIGFDDVTVHDLPMRRPVWPLLCDVARATSRVAVGPNVTHPFLSHPAATACSLAHLDDISDGRAVLGIGRGSLYGLVGLEPEHQLTAVAEAIFVIRLLVRGETGPWTGEMFALGEGAGLRFGRPHDVPVHVGTFGPNGARLAGRVANGVRAAAQWEPSWMVRVREWARQGAAQAGRDPAALELVPENWTYLAEDRERARRDAKRVLATFLPYLGPMIEFYDISDEELRAARAASIHGDEQAADAIGDATVDRFMAAGDASDLRRGLDALDDAGFHTVSFSGVLGPDPGWSLEVLGEELARRRAAAGQNRER